VLATIASAAVVGTVAGCLGSLLGLGGGIFLVPFLNVVVGLPFWASASVSLVAVIATSVGVSIAARGPRPINVRLAFVLLIHTALGATLGAAMVAQRLITEQQAKLVFGATAALIAIITVARLKKRNIVAGDDLDLGVLGGRFHDHDTGATVAYRIRRLPVALAVSVMAGVISTIAGVGGGILVVPTLNSWCRVPIRAAAATSAFMIGVTASPGVIGHYRQGHFVEPALAAAAVVGVLVGTRTGLWLSSRVRVQSLKLLLVVLLGFVAAEYLSGWR
jgi:uncharacterized membrane protein YfcA